MFINHNGDEIVEVYGIPLEDIVNLKGYMNQVGIADIRELLLSVDPERLRKYKRALINDKIKSLYAEIKILDDADIYEHDKKVFGENEREKIIAEHMRRYGTEE